MINGLTSLVLVIACLVAVHAECAQATTQTGQPAVVEVRARAERGDPAAQHSLGKRYYVGDGVPRDYAQAARYAEGLDELAQRMTPGQVADGRRLAQEWTAAFLTRR
jgi:hypothetical protein